MEWANREIRGAESSCSLGEYEEAGVSNIQMQITEKGFDESSDSVDPKEAKEGEDIFYGAGLSNDSSGNIIVLYKLKKIGSPIQRIFLSVLGWERLF